MTLICTLCNSKLEAQAVSKETVKVGCVPCQKRIEALEGLLEKVWAVAEEFPKEK